MCGESWLTTTARPLTHRPSSQGWASRCPLLHVYTCTCIYMYICLFVGAIVGYVHLCFLCDFLKLVCYAHVHVHVHGFESHLRQLIFSRKSDCLGCAVLLCLVCLFDLACFFLSSLI